MGVIADVTAGTPITPTWGNSIRDQVVATCTSGTRPASPAEGRIIYETDTDRLGFYDGTGWKLLEGSGTYTPTLTGVNQGTSPTNTAKWHFSGGLLHLDWQFVFGATGTANVTAQVTVSFPAGFTSSVTGTSSPYDSLAYMVAGGVNAMGFASTWTSTSARIYTLNAASTYLTRAITNTSVPGTWTNSNEIRLTAVIPGEMTL